MGDQNFPVRVSTMIPASAFKVLSMAAREHDTTVGLLVAELIRRGITPPKKNPRGRRSGYTRELGEQIFEARRFHRSHAEIGAEMGIAPGTAQRWLRRFEAERRATVLAAQDERRTA